MTMAETPNETSGALTDPMDRRSALKKAAAAGAIVWTAPMILSSKAVAAGGGTANCRPEITVSCIEYDCQQGGKFMPGIKVEASPCPCGTTATPPPTVCVKYMGHTFIGDASVAYGSPTTCGPQSPPDIILSNLINTWVCGTDDNNQIWFGNPRNANGSIDAIGSNEVITARISVWAGGCPDMDSTGGAFTCETYDVTLVWNQGSKTVTSCTVTDVAGDPGCAGTGESSPCTC
jgi:hypothetical protein